MPELTDDSLLVVGFLRARLMHALEKNKADVRRMIDREPTALEVCGALLEIIERTAIADGMSEQRLRLAHEIAATSDSEPSS